MSINIRDISGGFDGIPKKVIQDPRLSPLDVGLFSKIFDLIDQFRGKCCMSLRKLAARIRVPLSTLHEGIRKLKSCNYLEQTFEQPIFGGKPISVLYVHPSLFKAKEEDGEKILPGECSPQRTKRSLGETNVRQTGPKCSGATLSITNTVTNTGNANTFSHTQDMRVTDLSSDPSFLSSSSKGMDGLPLDLNGGEGDKGEYEEHQLEGGSDNQDQSLEEKKGLPIATESTDLQETSSHVDPVVSGYRKLFSFESTESLLNWFLERQSHPLSRGSYNSAIRVLDDLRLKYSIEDMLYTFLYMKHIDAYWTKNKQRNESICVFTLGKLIHVKCGEKDLITWSRLALPEADQVYYDAYMQSRLSEMSTDAPTASTSETPFIQVEEAGITGEPPDLVTSTSDTPSFSPSGHSDAVVTIEPPTISSTPISAPLPEGTTPCQHHRDLAGVYVDANDKLWCTICRNRCLLSVLGSLLEYPSLGIGLLEIVGAGPYTWASFVQSTIPKKVEAALMIARSMASGAGIDVASIEAEMEQIRKEIEANVAPA